MHSNDGCSHILFPTVGRRCIQFGGCFEHAPLHFRVQLHLSEQTFTQFQDRTGMRILERYGMSETLMNTSNPVTANACREPSDFPCLEWKSRL